MTCPIAINKILLQHSTGMCVLRLNQYYDRRGRDPAHNWSLNQYVHFGPCTLPFRPQPRVTWLVTYRIDSGALSVNRSWTSRWCHVVLNSVLATFEMFSLWIYDAIAAPKWDRFPVRLRLQWPLYQAGTMRTGAVQEAATAWHRHWYLPPEQDIISDFSRSKIHTDDVVPGGGGVLTIFWVTGRLGPFDPPFSTYVEFWPLLLGSDVEYWPPFFQAL